VLQSQVDFPYKAIKSNFADSVNLLLHIERKNGHRYVSQLLEVRGYGAEADNYELLPLSQKPQTSSPSAASTLRASPLFQGGTSGGSPPTKD